MNMRVEIYLSITCKGLMILYVTMEMSKFPRLYSSGKNLNIYTHTSHQKEENNKREL